MKLILLGQSSGDNLATYYERAFSSARELYVLSAYLTEWAPPKKLNSKCKTVQIIVGIDFGITRKAACRQLLSWLPSNRKHCAYLANGITGFHPKVIFWRERDGSCHMLLGSSNLTKAAFSRNTEANAYSKITKTEYTKALEWVRRLQDNIAPLTEDILDAYAEAHVRSLARHKKSSRASADFLEARLQLPTSRGLAPLLKHRRTTIENFQKVAHEVKKLFRRVASADIGSNDFYREIGLLWNKERNTRIQGAGWERLGRSSDFSDIGRALNRILDASFSERDDVVAAELDRLAAARNPARKAFLSEMLCLIFPRDYPILNRPVYRFLEDRRYRAAKGSSEGSAYLDLAKKLRFAVQVSKSTARNLAELDCVIWARYHE